MFNPENARQRGDHFSRFMPEQVFHHLRKFPAVYR